MKKIITFSNRIDAVLGHVLFFSYLGSIVDGNICRFHKVDPHEETGIGARNTLAESYAYRNFKRDGVSMAVWAAYPEPGYCLVG